MGSAPFRGGLSPLTAERVGGEYPSVVTFSIQSSFKFDYSVDQVRAACGHLRGREIKRASPIVSERAVSIIESYSEAYRGRIVELAPHINRMAKHVPKRRARKLHIGLFGYARELGEVTLPRAISFTCALYSLGLPPELIGFDGLSGDDLDFVMSAYPSFCAKVRDALRFADIDGPLMTTSLREALRRAGFEYAPDREHLSIVRLIRTEMERGDSAQVGDLVLRAALVRRFIG
jgi:phosphoenolpyruvate carboxylase